MDAHPVSLQKSSNRPATRSTRSKPQRNSENPPKTPPPPASFGWLDRLEKGLAGRPPAVPLTEREVAVLRLLGGTLSLREIGQELGLSQNTIKSHAKAIYRKLDVATRHDAAARGREIGIL
ncbi:MAG: response regulator transcription factor [Streptosporangiaceae bacterium]